MRLPELLQKYGITPQRLQAILAKHQVVPNLRLVREVPPTWEDILFQELGAPASSTPSFRVVKDALAELDANDEQGHVVALATTPPAVEALLVPELNYQVSVLPGLKVVGRIDANTLDQISAHNLPSSPSAVNAREKFRNGHQKINNRIPPDDNLSFGNVIGVVAEKGFGFVRKAGTNVEIFWNIKQLDGNLPAVNDWLVFADQPSRKHEGKWEVSWARPLSQDQALLRRVLGHAEWRVLHQLLDAKLDAGSREMVATELFARLEPAIDSDTLATVVRTLELARQKGLPANEHMLSALATRSDPEFGWQLWLRYCSPLAVHPEVAGRLLKLLETAPEVALTWWAQMLSSGINGLYLAYVSQASQADLAIRFQKLKTALGGFHTAEYDDLISQWASSIETASSAADFRLQQRVLRMANDEEISAVLEQRLVAQLSSDVVLEVWLTGNELPFPHAAALARFEHLTATEQDRVAGELTDAEIRGVLGYLTEQNSEALRLRAGRLVEDALISALSAVAVDLESDGTAIREIAWGRPDHWHTGKGSVQVKTVLALLGEQHTSQPSLMVGHNVRDFDAPILAAHGITVGMDWLWDTLLVEMALSPQLHTYALRTAHTAAADAALTWQLFISQLWRLVRLEKTAWQMQKGLFAPSVLAELAHWRTELAGATWLAASVSDAEAAVLDWLRPQPPRSALVQKLAVKLADEALPMRRLVLAPREVWGELSHLPGLRFWIDEDAELDYQELDEAAVVAQLHERPAEATMAACFFAYCRLTDRAPVPAAMAPALRVRLSQHVVFSECQATEPANEPTAHCRCLAAEQLLGAQVELAERTDVAVLVVEPDLLTLGHKRLLRDRLTINDLLSSERSRTEWIKFSGGQSFVGLTQEQAADLRAEAPAGYDRFWLEKNRQGSFRVWGSFDWETVLMQVAPVVLDTMLEPARAYPAGQLNLLAVNAPRLQQRLGVTPFNPESIYRARYWLLQAEIMGNIGQRGQSAPLVLLTPRREEVAVLGQYFRSLGYYVPDPAAAPGRQLELLHQSGGRRVLIAAQERAAAVLQANYLGPLEVVLDGFALLENYFLAEGSALFRQAWQTAGGEGEQSASDTRDSGGEHETVPGDGATETDLGIEDEPTAAPGAAQKGRPKYEYLMRDVQFLLALQRPVVERLRALAYDNHPDSRIWLLDPRLDEFEGLAQTWGMRKHVADVRWAQERDRESAAAAYQAAAKDAEEIFGGGLPPADFQIDIEEAKLLLELVFLRFYEQGKWVQKSWTEQQMPYLDKILPAQTSLLVSLPTGGGKSLLFQGPALYRSAYTNRLSIVVTPLKALMQDQVEGLWKRGFYSSVDYLNQDKQDEVQQIYSRLAGGELMLLFITPERFRSRGFANAFAQRLASDGGLEYAIYDEAHCISQWGHEFRPDYLHSARTVEGHRKVSTHQFPVLLFSATVTEKIYTGFTELFG